MGSASWWWANKCWKHVEAINRNKPKASSAFCWSYYADNNVYFIKFFGLSHWRWLGLCFPRKVVLIECSTLSRVARMFRWPLVWISVHSKGRDEPLNWSWTVVESAHTYSYSYSLNSQTLSIVEYETKSSSSYRWGKRVGFCGKQSKWIGGVYLYL
jgi:hypothetical protein